MSGTRKTYYNAEKPIVKRLCAALATLMEPTLKNNASLAEEGRKYMLNMLNECKENHEISNIIAFYGNYPPDMSFKDYLLRFAEHNGLTKNSFILSIQLMSIFDQRAQKAISHFCLSPFNIHRIFAISALLATKFLEEDYYNNAHYAKLAGISTKELNNLEIVFLFFISFDLFDLQHSFKEFFAVEKALIDQANLNSAEAKIEPQQIEPLEFPDKAKPSNNEQKTPPEACKPPIAQDGKVAKADGISFFPLASKPLGKAASPPRNSQSTAHP